MTPSRKRSALLGHLALIVVLATGLGAADGKRKKHRHKKPPRVPAALTLFETPVQSGLVTSSKAICVRRRYIEVRRADNGALVATGTSRDDGSFGAPGGYSGPAYAYAAPLRRKKARCLGTMSPGVSVGVADTRITQTAVPSTETGGHPAYDIVLTGGGPDAAQDVVIRSTPQAQPANPSFGLDAANSSPGCTLAAGIVTCKLFGIYPGQSVTRRIALTCPVGTVNFRNAATVTTSARDPDSANNSTGDLSSSGCI